MNQWLRLYTSVLDDPKVQRLPAEQFKAWVNILCLAKENDGLLPDVGDIAFRLRMLEADAQSLVDKLLSCGLLDVTENGLMPHAWNERQFQSDSSTPRVKRHRERFGNVSPPKMYTVPVTPQIQIQSREETETEAEESRTEAPQAAPASRGKPRSARKPKVCDEEWLVELQASPAYKHLDVHQCYYRAVEWCRVKGRQPTRQFFINWLNREQQPMTLGGNNGRTQTGQTGNDANRGTPQKTTDDYGIRDCQIL